MVGHTGRRIEVEAQSAAQSAVEFRVGRQIEVEALVVEVLIAAQLDQCSAAPSLEVEGNAALAEQGLHSGLVKVPPAETTVPQMMREAAIDAVEYLD